MNSLRQSMIDVIREQLLNGDKKQTKDTISAIKQRMKTEMLSNEVIEEYNKLLPELKKQLKIDEQLIADKNTKMILSIFEKYRFLIESKLLYEIKQRFVINGLWEKNFNRTMIFINKLVLTKILIRTKQNNKTFYYKGDKL